MARADAPRLGLGDWVTVLRGNTVVVSCDMRKADVLNLLRRDWPICLHKRSYQNVCAL